MSKKIQKTLITTLTVTLATSSMGMCVFAKEKSKEIDDTYNTTCACEEIIKVQNSNKLNQRHVNSTRGVFKNFHKAHKKTVKKGVLVGYKVKLSNHKLYMYKNNKNSTKITVYKIDSYGNNLGIVDNNYVNIEVFDLKGNNAQIKKEINIDGNEIKALKEGIYLVKVKVGSYLLKQISLKVVNTAPKPTSLIINSKAVNVNSETDLDSLFKKIGYTVKDQFGNKLNSELTNINYYVANEYGATIKHALKDRKSLQDRVGYTGITPNGNSVNEGTLNLIISDVTLKDCKSINKEKKIYFDMPLVIYVTINSQIANSSKDSKTDIKLKEIEKLVLKDQANVEKQKDIVKTLKKNNDKAQSLSKEIEFRNNNEYNKIGENIKKVNDEINKLMLEFNNLQKQAEEFDKLQNIKEELLNKKDNLITELEVANKNNRKVKQESLRIELKEVIYKLEKVEEEIYVNKFKESKVNKNLEKVEDKLELKRKEVINLNIQFEKAKQKLENIKKVTKKAENKLKKGQTILENYEDKLVADLNKILTNKGPFRFGNAKLNLNLLKENKNKLSIKTNENGIYEIVLNIIPYTL